MGRTMIGLVLGLTLAGLAACSSTPSKARPSADNGSVDELARWMEGAFTSQDQAQGDGDFLDIRLHMARIWRSRSDGAWLYVEQAAADAIDRPYRQRIYHLSWDQSLGAFRSEAYTLPFDPLTFAGAWASPSAFDAITPDRLTRRAGCAVILTKGDGVYAGSTKGQACVSDLAGATYATSEVSITPSEITSWDRGFDDVGVQKWGSLKGAYRFRKVR